MHPDDKRLAQLEARDDSGEVKGRIAFALECLAVAEHRAVVTDFLGRHWRYMPPESQAGDLIDAVFLLLESSCLPADRSEIEQFITDMFVSSFQDLP